MKKINFLVVIILILLCVIALLAKLFSNTKYSNEPKESIMQQLNKIESIYRIARATRNKQPDSDWGSPNPRDAINIIDNAISELENLKVGNVLMRYRDMSIDILKYVKKHHELRLLEKDPSLFDSKARGIYLKHFHIEGEREKEYRRIVRQLK